MPPAEGRSLDSLFHAVEERNDTDVQSGVQGPGATGVRPAPSRLEKTSLGLSFMTSRTSDARSVYGASVSGVPLRTRVNYVFPAVSNGRVRPYRLSRVCFWPHFKP